jgi:hypothetical protein
MRYLLAADTGGAFTDIVVFDQRTKATQFGKTLTNYRDLVAGVLDGLSDTDGHLDEAAVFKHGTTHVINAFVQRKGARTALVTTEGFRDLLEIGSGNRTSPFNLAYRRFAPLVPRELRFEVTERTLADGTAVQAPDPIALRDIADWSAEALAVIPTYYIIDLDKTMPETVAPEMPPPEAIAAKCMAAGCGAGGLRGGVSAHRVSGRLAMVPGNDLGPVRRRDGIVCRPHHRCAEPVFVRETGLGRVPESGCL